MTGGVPSNARLGAPFRRWLIPLVALFVTLGQLVAPAAVAQQSNKSIPDLQRSIDDASKQEQQLVAELTQIQSQRADLESKAAAIGSELDTAQARVGELRRNHDALNVEIFETALQLRDAKQIFGVTAAALYRTARRGAGYNWFLQAQPRDLSAGNEYLSQVSGRRNRELRRIDNLRGQLDGQERQLAEQQRQAEAQTAEVQRLLAQQQAAVADITTKQRAEEQKLSEVRAQRATDEAALAAAQLQIARLLAARSHGATASRPCALWPVVGPIVSGFGYRTDPIDGSTKFHSGVDIAASMGTPIKACLGGTVVFSGSLGGYGNAVVIDHGGGMGTLYAHQSKLGSSVNETVSAGQVIGYVGSTGHSTGPHLHFEVRLNGNPVNPVPYLP